jgi:RimJ/RimL family protein N-acetyltransferase
VEGAADVRVTDAAGIALLTGIRLRTPRLELRLPDDQEIAALAAVAAAGVHPPDEMPFVHPWTDRSGMPTFAAEIAAYHRGCRERWDPETWMLELGVFVDGRVVGGQALRAERFAETRIVDTGSWLGQAHQGVGIGTEMRAAVLELAFSGLGAVAATSGALEGNAASARVSAKLGYDPDGERIVSPRGSPVRERRFRITAGTWVSPVPVEIIGLEPLLPLFGCPPHAG